MINNSLTVGVTAVFDPATTPHARTFLRALGSARNHLPVLSSINFAFGDDAADPKEAKKVAEDFIANDVDLVVGHFSSDAALAVLDAYANADIPLLTPAATATAITDGPTCYQLCPNDAQLAAFLLSFTQNQNWSTLRVASDDSEHGKAIAKEVRAHATSIGIQIAEDATSDAVIFAGRLAASQSYLQHHRKSDPNIPLVLTDDAVSPHMPEQIGLKAPVYAVGFRPAEMYPRAGLVCRKYELVFGAPPETYFLESYAAFEIISALAQMDQSQSLSKHLAGQIFETTLGDVRFQNGHANTASHTLWSLGPRGFAPRGSKPIDTMTSSYPSTSNSK